MNSVFESIESLFSTIEQALLALKSSKEDEYGNVEKLIAKLDDQIVIDCVNGERQDLIERTETKRRSDLSLLNLTNLMTFHAANRLKAIDDFKFDLNRRLTYKNGFNVQKKLSYLHILRKPIEYVDYDLFDIKYPHSQIKLSSLVSSNRIFLLIALTNSDHILQVHQINRSSLSTCKQVTKRSLFKYDVQFAENRIIFVFNYRYIDVYDFNLNLIKQIDALATEGSFLSHKCILTNGAEVIFDHIEFYRIYDLDLKSFCNLGQTQDSNKPFFIDVKEGLQLINVSKQLLVYLTPDRLFIRCMSRDSGNFISSFNLASVLDIPHSNFYISLSFFIDFNSSLVYFKADNSRSIFCLDSKNLLVHIIQNYYVSDGFQLSVLNDRETSLGEEAILFLKRNVSTRNLKNVFIF